MTANDDFWEEKLKEWERLLTEFEVCLQEARDVVFSAGANAKLSTIENQMKRWDEYLPKLEAFEKLLSYRPEEGELTTQFEVLEKKWNDMSVATRQLKSLLISELLKVSNPTTQHA
jgi:hypothetical protein